MRTSSDQLERAGLESGRVSWKHGILLGFILPLRIPIGDRQMAVLIPHIALAAKGIAYSKPHLWRLEKAGKFPKRVMVGAGRYGYVESEIDGYIDQKIAERDTGKRGA
jgi:prophage regulatory protein